MDHDASARDTTFTHDAPLTHDDSAPDGAAPDGARSDPAARRPRARPGAVPARQHAEGRVFTRTARVAGIVRRDPDVHGPGVAMLHAACMGA